MILDKTRENNLLRKISFKIAKKICKKGLKYCKSARTYLCTKKIFYQKQQHQGTQYIKKNRKASMSFKNVFVIKRTRLIF